MSTVPRSLLYITGQMAGVQKNTSRVFPINGSDFTNQQIITFDLPSAGLIDLSTLFCSFKAGVSADEANSTLRLPGDIHKLLQRVVVRVGGIIVSDFNEFGRFKHGHDNLTGKSVSNAAHPEILRSYDNQLDYSSTFTTTKNQVINDEQGLFAWSEFANTFLDSTTPRILNMDYLPQCYVDFHLASDICTASNGISDISTFTTLTTATGAPVVFDIKDPQLKFDMVSFDTAAYDNLIESEMQSTGKLSIPFKRCRHSVNNTFNLSHDFNVQTESLDRIHFQVSDAAAKLSTNRVAPVVQFDAAAGGDSGKGPTLGGAEGYYNPKMASSFVAGADASDYENYAYQLTLNGTPAPNYFAGATDWYKFSRDAVSEHCCSYYKGSLPKWIGNNHCVYRLNLPNSANNYRTGLDTRAANLFMTLQNKMGIETACVDVWCEYTSVLEVMPGRTAVLRP